MKIIILVLTLFIILTGCDSFDNLKCMETVQLKYPQSHVYALPDKDYRFIVFQPNGIARYVMVRGSWDVISDDIIIKQ